MMSHARFISLEGLDGAGKSTHLTFIRQWLQQQGIDAVFTREPGGTPLGEKLRDILLDIDTEATLDTETLLMFASRQELISTVIRPQLAAGNWVVSDRFTDATFAYQGGGRGFDWNSLSLLERLAQTGLAPQPDLMREPDLTLWFDLAPAVAAERLALARTPDRFESLETAFFERVAQGYARRAAEAPQRFARLDAAEEREQVWLQLHAVLVGRGWLPAVGGAA